ncbi:MAG: hypothetical protein ACYTDW_12620 [Planctomycetota bacterium]|jgi:hypothetical protein
MKKKKTITGMYLLTVWIVLLVILAASAASGQYELSWYTIDGGGGQSTGGQYKLIGTIGQPDAAYSAGGNYELLSGFWPGGPLCFIDFEHFARFAQYWLEPGTGSPADLYEDLNNKVNELDLRIFVDQWLCYCPENWPLK